MRSFYQDAGKWGGELDYVEDLVDVFQGQTSAMYIDSRHPNDEGNGIIALRVAEELAARGLLDKKENASPSK